MLQVNATHVHRVFFRCPSRDLLRVSLSLGPHCEPPPSRGAASRGTMRLMSIALLLAFASGVTGCVLPPAFTIASLMADGVSLASSGKTVTDHAISLLAHEDCRLWRLLEGKSVCGSQATVVTVAQLPALPLRAASPATRPPEPIT